MKSPIIETLAKLCKQWIKDGSPGEAAAYAKVAAHHAFILHPDLREK